MSSTMSLTKPLAKWAAEQAKACGQKTASDYVNQLLREEQKRQAVQLLIKNLEEAEASGYYEVTEKSWEDRKKRVAAHFKVKAGKKV